MGKKEDTPVVFANQVVKQFADHLFGDAELDTDAYTTIRVTYRKMGGSWVLLCDGDIKMLNLMANVVQAWDQASP